MHYNLVIISNNILDDFLNNINMTYQIFNTNHYLIDEYTLNNNVTFDYAILTDPKSFGEIEVLKDDNVIIVNYYFQTSKEHIFFIGKENNSNLDLRKQLEIIMNYFQENN